MEKNDARQILILPYYIDKSEDKLYYALFKSKDTEVWMGVSGGCHFGEDYEKAAIREAEEEIGFSGDILQLDTVAYIRKDIFYNFKDWNDDILVIPQVYFGMQLKKKLIALNDEFIEFIWVDFESAYKMLFFQNNKTAIWELNARLLKKLKGKDFLNYRVFSIDCV